MYEDVTYEVLLQRMLDRVPSTIDTREGSILYNALAPAAVELQNMYIELDSVLGETFADTASLAYLIRRAAERGIYQEKATKAVLHGLFNLNINVGSRFTGDKLNYVVTEKISDYNFKLECETAGVAGNEYVGNLIPINYIEGLASAELTAVLIPGEDDEDVETLRTRYFSSLNTVAFGGNIADYKQKVNAIDGVGGVKVYPVWDGGGTVKLVIINSSYDIASTALADTVQTTIDPITNSGQGLGLAPVGHTVTVVSADQQTVDITATITYQSGWVWADIQIAVYAMLDNYFIELNRTWADHDNLIVRMSQIETRLLDIEGILDVENMTLNGIVSNLTLDANSIAVRGTVSG